MNRICRHFGLMDIYVLQHVFKFFLLAPELQDLEQVAVVCVYDDMTVSVRVSMRVGMRVGK